MPCGGGGIEWSAVRIGANGACWAGANALARPAVVAAAAATRRNTDDFWNMVVSFVIEVLRPGDYYQYMYGMLFAVAACLGRQWSGVVVVSVFVRSFVR